MDDKFLTSLKKSTLDDTKISRISKVANEIYQEKGEINNEDIIESARPEDSPIHDCFPWDDKEIADNARRWLATQYICRIKVTFIDDVDEEQMSQRVFRSVSIKYLENGEEKSKQTFKRIDDILSEETLRKQVVADLLARQEYWTQESKKFTELKGIVNETELQRIRESFS